MTEGAEQGLHAIAFHPDFADNGRFFVHYNDDQDRNVIAEFKGSPCGTASSKVVKTLLAEEQPFPNNNAGWLGFGPDGYLYIPLGDGGGVSPGDPNGIGQSPSTRLSKVLRIDVNVRSDKLYAIPQRQPLRPQGRGFAPETWAMGLRDPRRASFDRKTGDLWIGDQGQDSFEEVDRIPAGEAGLNFGWSDMEGDRCHNLPDCDPSAYELPVHVYDQVSPQCGVVGGYVYRGSAIPALDGVYLFSDFCSGFIWGIDADAVAAGAKPWPISSSTRRRASSRSARTTTASSTWSPSTGASTGSRRRRPEPTGRRASAGHRRVRGTARADGPFGRNALTERTRPDGCAMRGTGSPSWRLRAATARPRRVPARGRRPGPGCSRRSARIRAVHGPRRRDGDGLAGPGGGGALEARPRHRPGCVRVHALGGPMAGASRRLAASSGVADADAMPLREAGVDVALSSFMLQLVDDRRAVLREIHRVLRPGGLLGLVTWLADDTSWPPTSSSTRPSTTSSSRIPWQRPLVRRRHREPRGRAPTWPPPRSRPSRSVDALDFGWSRQSYLEFKEEYDEWDLLESLSAADRHACASGSTSAGRRSRTRPSRCGPRSSWPRPAAEPLRPRRARLQRPADAAGPIAGRSRLLGAAEADLVTGRDAARVVTGREAVDARRVAAREAHAAAGEALQRGRVDALLAQHLRAWPPDRRHRTRRCGRRSARPGGRG